MRAFKNLKYQQLKTLIDVINSTEESRVEVIKRRYRNLSDNYIGASRFLKELKILTERKDRLVVKTAFRFSMKGLFEDEALKALILNELLTTRNKLTNDVWSYLNNFTVIRNAFKYKPLTSARIKESSLRNFLMDLGLIDYNRSTGTYKIREEHYSTFEVFLQNNKLAPQELSVILKWKEELGRAAEIVVLDFEKKRLAGYPELVKKVRYTAEDDTKAGYDILSWEISGENEKSLERYIEVKAVSKFNYRFYWSRNEMNMAKKYREQYHLYLLPVVGKKNFDIKSLEIIPNPKDFVFDNTELWYKEVESYSFSKVVNQ